MAVFLANLSYDASTGYDPPLFNLVAKLITSVCLVMFSLLVSCPLKMLKLCLIIIYCSIFPIGKNRSKFDNIFFFILNFELEQ